MSKHFGMAFQHEQGHNLSVACWLEENKAKYSYNLSDRTGEHMFRKTKHSSAFWSVLQKLKSEARKMAEEKRDYAAQRRRETAFEDLRYAFCVTVGRGGYTVYVDEEPNASSRIEGYDLKKEMMDEIDRLGIPFIDSRPAKDVWETVGFPMIADKPGREDPAPWGGMSYAPLSVVAALYANIGAIVKNVKPDFELAKQVRGYTAREAAMLVAYERGDETALGMLMLQEEKGRE